MPKPRVVDGLLALALATALEVHLFVTDVPGASPVGVIAGLVLTLPLAWRRRAPLAVMLVYAATVPLQEVLGGGLHAGDPPVPAMLVAGAVAFYSLGAHAPDRAAALGVALGLLGLWTSSIVSGDTDLESFAFATGLVALSPWLAGRTLRARARERDQRTRRVASEERQRIARELHDVVAHGVVLMVLQAQGARRIFDRDPERAREALAAIEESGQTALSEIRRSLGMLRDDDLAPDRSPQPTLGDLGGLVEEMRRAGLAIELEVAGDERELADGIDRSAYRIIQEALTNTIQHAGLVPTRVTVSYEADALRLEIADEGPGRPRAPDGGHPGRGLAGMRERVRLYGGELEARAADGHGFVVRARIPLAS